MPKFKVKEFVARMGITQKELAEKLGVKPEAVYKWANGTNTPVYDVIYKLKKMGATDYELFGETFTEQEEFFKRRLLNAHNRFLEEMGVETILAGILRQSAQRHRALATTSVGVVATHRRPAS